MDDKLTIHVTISERTYPINIKRGDSEGEARIRQASDLINNTVNQFRKLGYVNRDEQDYLAMSALQLCLKIIEKDSNVDISPIINKLKDISLIIDEILEKEQKVL